MFSVANLDEFYKQRYLALYPVALPYISHHGSGVMYDQVTARAIFQQDMDDGESTMVGRSLHLLSPGEEEGPKLSGRLEWLPLEQILDSYLDMIDQGKVVAVSTEPKPDTDDGDCQEWVDPWIMPSYTEDDLRATLTQFQRLVEAIESRMPPDSLVNLDIQFGCLDLGDEDGQGEESPEESIPVLRPNEFARHFLAAARRPRFEFIAPRLSWVVAGPQPFKDADYIGDLDEYMRPVLLARGDGDAVDLPDGLDEFEDIPDNLPCGLYLTELNKIDRAPFEVCVSSSNSAEANITAKYNKLIPIHNSRMAVVSFYHIRSEPTNTVVAATALSLGKANILECPLHSTGLMARVMTSSSRVTTRSLSAMMCSSDMFCSGGRSSWRRDTGRLTNVALLAVSTSGGRRTRRRIGRNISYPAIGENLAS